jgi:hypothetical protein
MDRRNNVGRPRLCDACGHPLVDHSPEPALDGRTGCRAAIGIVRCACLYPDVPWHVLDR